ncbi:MAG: hypothetical protein L6Q60_14430 [Rhodocyclaceae bacterium]|nr:hypothetical protein [Rhodocyclaceae bacterium]
MVARSSSERWGIAEWYGRDITALTNAERKVYAQDAKKSVSEVCRPCPFMGSFIPGFTCNKKGGICSTQKYASSGGSTLPTGKRVAICPSRLVTKDVLLAIASDVLDATSVLLVREVPYSLSLVNKRSNGAPAYAGRIDWILVDKDNPENFCAVETQSVYMSGKSQDADFDEIERHNGVLTAPVHFRHPDYKSSVPKRLGPQLESKARHLTNAARKTVVLVDDYVFDNMSELREVQIPEGNATTPAEKKANMLEACEVIFAITKLEPAEGLSPPSFLYTTIADSRTALDAVSPMPAKQFFRTINEIVQAKTKATRAKVFPL